MANTGVFIYRDSLENVAYFYRNVQNVFFGWFERWEVSGRTASNPPNHLNDNVAVSLFALSVSFYHPSFRYNVDNYKMLIRIFHNFLNRSINIVMDDRVVGFLPISPYWALLTVISTERFRCQRGKSISV